MFDKLELSGTDLLLVMQAMHKAMVSIDGATIRDNNFAYRASTIELKKSDHFEISLGVLLAIRYVYFPPDPEIEERVIRVLSIQRVKGGSTPIDKETVPLFLSMFGFDPKGKTQVNFSEGGAMCMQKVSDDKFQKFKKIFDLNQALKEKATKN